MDKPTETSDKPNDYEGPWHQYHVEKTRFLRASTELAEQEPEGEDDE